MAAYDIQKHFKGLRVAAGRRRSRADPFATGFEDEIEDEKNRPSRNKTKAGTSPPTSSLNPGRASAPARSSLADIDSFRDRDHVFLDPPTRTDRRPSPAPALLPATRVTDGAGRRGSVDLRLQQQHHQHRPVRAAVEQAAGTLAYLDDSEDEEELLRPPRSNQRYSSPGPRRDRSTSTSRSSPPKGSGRTDSHQNPLQPSRHTVASPFAGTKYLEDSSDSDEEAVTSRTNSTDDTNSERPDSPGSLRFEVKRTDKPRVQNGGGVSWRAFSAGRAEQRNNEIEALQANFRRRGRTISFCPHAVTDDGVRVPIAAASETACASSSAVAARKGPGKLRRKSPPRRDSDTRPDDDEFSDGGPIGIYDPSQYKTNPFTGKLQSLPSDSAHDASRFGEAAANPAASGISSSFGMAHSAASSSSLFRASPPSDHDPMSPDSPSDRSAMADSIHSITSLTMVSPPQTIPEGKYVELGTSPMSSPHDGQDSLSRNASVRSLLMSTSRPMRIPSTRRMARRSTSVDTSVSPAHAFLSTWSNSGPRNHEPAPEPQPDDEGQAIGVNNEYIIGRQINQGGFGIVKEVHTINDSGRNIVRAVKIVRKSITGQGDAENEKTQAELDHEISIWRHLKHRHILDLIAVYETDFATFCVMELNVGGTLFDVVRRTRASASRLETSPRSKGLDPAIAQAYARQLASALRYLHEDMKVVHRDVKLENCLIDSSSIHPITGVGNLRLCDFGLADFLHSAEAGALEEITSRESLSALSFSPSTSTLHHLNPRTTTSSVIGTLEYASPKGLSSHRKLYDTAGDIWAFGVIVYALCTGELPFRHPMPAKTVEMILSAEWDENCLVRSTTATAAAALASATSSGFHVPSADVPGGYDRSASLDSIDALRRRNFLSAETAAVTTVAPDRLESCDSTVPGRSGSVGSTDGLRSPTFDSPPISASNSTSPTASSNSPVATSRGRATLPVVELVRGCLEKDMALRWTITDCISCAWFEGCPSDDEQEDDNDGVEMRWRRR